MKKTDKEKIKKSPVTAPKQERSINTRKKIIDSSMKLFSIHGHDNTSIEMITKDAGIGLGTFYTHFNNKLEIFLETLEQHLRDTTSASERIYNRIYEMKMPLDEAVDFLIREMFISSRDNMRLFLERREYILSSERFRNVYREEESRGLLLLQNFFDTYRKKIKSHDVESFALILANMIIITFVILYQTPDLDRERVLNELVLSVKYMVIK
jgi:AcrR family transcriptional regulator